MSNNPLGNLLGNVGGLFPHQGYLQHYGMNDKRTDREKLTSKLELNEKLIEEKIKENEEIKEALKHLDEHPMIEKMNNLIKKLID
jgi:hypothetical protein